MEAQRRSGTDIDWRSGSGQVVVAFGLAVVVIVIVAVIAGYQFLLLEMLLY